MPRYTPPRFAPGDQVIYTIYSLPRPHPTLRGTVVRVKTSTGRVTFLAEDGRQRTVLAGSLALVAPSEAHAELPSAPCDALRAQLAPVALAPLAPEHVARGL